MAVGSVNQRKVHASGKAQTQMNKLLNKLQDIQEARYGVVIARDEKRLLHVFSVLSEKDKRSVLDFAALLTTKYR